MNKQLTITVDPNNQKPKGLWNYLFGCSDDKELKAQTHCASSFADWINNPSAANAHQLQLAMRLVKDVKPASAESELIIDELGNVIGRKATTADLPMVNGLRDLSTLKLEDQISVLQVLDAAQKRDAKTRETENMSFAPTIKAALGRSPKPAPTGFDMEAPKAIMSEGPLTSAPDMDALVASHIETQDALSGMAKDLAKLVKLMSTKK